MVKRRGARPNLTTQSGQTAGLKIHGIITAAEINKHVENAQLAVLQTAEKAKDFEVDSEQLLMFADLALALCRGKTKRQIAEMIKPELERYISTASAPLPP